MIFTLVTWKFLQGHLEKIVEAFEKQDEEMAEHYAKEHIEDFVEKIKSALL